MNGIYCITINGKRYIGKDVYIQKQVRIKEHLKLLGKGTHYNTYLQRAYNKYPHKLNTEVLLEVDCTKEELASLEIQYIEAYSSYTKGYNLTKGGEGGLGYLHTEEELQARSLRTRGANNPQSKLSSEDVLDIIRRLQAGSTNKEIADVYNLSSGYISLIRNKHRYKHLWEKVSYSPNTEYQINRQSRKLSLDQFKEVVYLINEGRSNASIEREYGLSGGTVSRIRHKKLYKHWWNKIS